MPHEQCTHFSYALSLLFGVSKGKVQKRNTYTFI